MTVRDAIDFADNCSESELRKLGTTVNRRIAVLNKLKKTGSAIAISYTQFGYQLAERIAANLKEVYPLAKDAPLPSWADEIDKITRIDKIPEPVVELVLAHALQDKFWRNQIRSGSALRRHFEKIYMNGKNNFDQEAAKKPKIYKV